MIRVCLPAHLQQLAHCSREITLDCAATQAAVLDELEHRYPMLRGCLRHQQTGQRRAFVRFYACGEDLSFEPPESPLPAAVAEGREPFRVVGAMAGG